jgi:hypothetical protein
MIRMIDAPWRGRGRGFSRNDPVMSRRAACVTQIGGAARPLTGAAVAAALLLQLFVMPPLAMRMLSAMTAGGLPAALCASVSSARLPAPEQPSQPPALPRAHDLCPLCQSHSVPLSPIPVGIVIVALITSWRWVRRAALAMPAPAAPFRLYSARAPPALA